jgi:hypothetical protein
LPTFAWRMRPDAGYAIGVRLPLVCCVYWLYIVNVGACLCREHAQTRTRTHTHTYTHAKTRTKTHARTHTQTGHIIVEGGRQDILLQMCAMPTEHYVLGAYIAALVTTALWWGVYSCIRVLPLSARSSRNKF